MHLSALFTSEPDLLNRAINSLDVSNLKQTSRFLSNVPFAPCNIRISSTERSRVKCEKHPEYTDSIPIYKLGTDPGETKSQLLCLLNNITPDMQMIFIDDAFTYGPNDNLTFWDNQCESLKDSMRCVFEKIQTINFIGGEFKMFEIFITKVLLGMKSFRIGFDNRNKDDDSNLDPDKCIDFYAKMHSTKIFDNKLVMNNRNLRNAHVTKLLEFEWFKNLTEINLENNLIGTVGVNVIRLYIRDQQMLHLNSLLLQNNLLTNVSTDWKNTFAMNVIRELFWIHWMSFDTGDDMYVFEELCRTGTFELLERNVTGPRLKLRFPEHAAYEKIMITDFVCKLHIEEDGEYIEYGLVYLEDED